MTKRKRYKQSKSLGNKKKISSVIKKNKTELNRTFDVLNIRFVRFLIVGTINTGLSYGIYALLLFINVEYKFANLGALLIGIIVGFKTQGKFVFNNPNNRLFLRFLLSWIIIYLFNIFLIGRLIGLGFDAYQAGAIALVPVTLFSYFTQKFIVFRQKNFRRII